MLETIGNFLSNIAIYVAALLGLAALYFIWVTLREWQSGRRAAFGVERDMASSEMAGAIARAAVVIFLGLVVLGLGRLGQKPESSGGTEARATQPAAPTTSALATPTQGSGEPATTVMPADTPAPAATTAVAPASPTQPPVVEPTPQRARVAAVGGVWLRDAPNGGTIQVLPQETTVELLEGHEFAGSYDWQKVQVVSAPPGSDALVNLEGWVASQFLEELP